MDASIAKLEENMQKTRSKLGTFRKLMRKPWKYMYDGQTEEINALMKEWNMYENDIFSILV